LVGTPLQGRVLVIDDVITAGTAVREVIKMIDEAGATLAGVVIGLDRQERGVDQLSAVQEVERAHDAPVLSIINMGHIIDYLEAEDQEPPGALAAMRQYRQQYGV
jgi:orotate phosphoribosyltransferase